MQTLEGLDAFDTLWSKCLHRSCGEAAAADRGRHLQQAIAAEHHLNALEVSSNYITFKHNGYAHILPKGC